MHALELNGVDSLERIDVYIKDDVERYGTKLEDCHRRLKRFLAELLVMYLSYSANSSVLPFRKEKMAPTSSMNRTRVSSAVISQTSWTKTSLASENLVSTKSLVLFLSRYHYCGRSY